jgi:hypothetical protein
VLILLADGLIPFFTSMRAKLSTSVLETFKYAPLTSKSTIRLLELESSSTKATRCRMKEYHLEDAPAFDALSYTWGYPLTPFSNAGWARQQQSPEGLRMSKRVMTWKKAHSRRSKANQIDWDHQQIAPIICNDATMLVTANLRNALKMLKHTDFSKSGISKSRFVWIDAIVRLCVSQASHPNTDYNKSVWTSRTSKSVMSKSP